MRPSCVLRRVHLLFLSVFLLAAGISAGVMAEEPAETSGKSPLILIEAGSPDENGFFDVTVNAENLEFLVSEIALRYDGKTVCPVGTDGEPAKDFSDFAKAVRFDGVSRIGEKLDAEKGYFLFTLFANPGTESDYVWNTMVHFGEKTELYRFRFKKIADGDYGFSLASAYDGGVYDPFFPDGAVVTSATEKRHVSELVIRVLGADGKPVSEKKQQTVYYYYSELYPKNFTKEQRLSGTVYLVKGDYAAAADGALAVIDPDNREVRPFEKDGKMLYPLRFVCESLKCTVTWNEETGTATVTRPDGGESVITLSGESAATDAMTADDTLLVENDRIMASEKLLAAISGARSYDAGNGMVFYTGIPEWTPDRDAEKQALEAMQYVLMPIFRMFLDL